MKLFENTIHKAVFPYATKLQDSQSYQKIGNNPNLSQEKF
jgi:hypothetical protein